MSGESKTEAVRQRRAEIERYLEREVWARIPRELLGRAPDREEVEEILGFDPEGMTSA